jgi:regulator of RNase E activity RraA
LPRDCFEAAAAPIPGSLLLVPPILGFRIVPPPPRLDAALVARFRGVASPNLADAMGRFNFMDPGISSRTGLTLCGLAVTVNARPADNLMVHKALQVASPGDVIVVNTCGNTTSAVFGELMCNTAVAAKLGGIVVDGAIRDVDGLTALAFPAFSRSVSAGGCDKDGPGEINVPVSCGGVVVSPGDIVVGDRDGVVVVPRADAEQVLSLVQALVDRETKRVAEIKSGVLFRTEIDESLRKKGVIE